MNFITRSFLVPAAHFLCLGVLFFALAPSPGARGADVSPLKVFVLAGQSNMAGHGATADLPPELRQPQPNVLMFQDGAWTPLKPGRAIGPEQTFGPAMAKYFGQTIGIVKYAVGGTDLAQQWSPDDPKSLYAHLVQTVKAAQSSRPITIVGMLWMQGEKDSHEQAMADAYQKNLTHLIESARRDFGNPNLLFLCGRVNPHTHYVDLVRKAQESITLPDYRMVSCDGLTKNQDNLHYDAKGQEELGQRFAAAAIDLLSPKTTQKKAP